MTYEGYRYGDIVMYYHQASRSNYIGFVREEKIASDEDGNNLFVVTFWSPKLRRIGNTLHLRSDQIKLIGPMPEEAEWDV